MRTRGGESLFLKDVWPRASLGVYCEFFRSARARCGGPEFPPQAEDAARLRLKNINYLLHFDRRSGAVTHPLAGQHVSVHFKNRITVVHDGIDTQAVAPNPQASITLNGQLNRRPGDEVVTFVNRNLSLTGATIFMRLA